ncbi:DNA repair protein RecO [Betaproteobacteria bacterium]|nr:DNA repair protein RecO [Betaproteobacteria bacterium]GHU01747.1 DNA repair protein RecO [Betaproteobacteria bacterium]GHU21366.1 DNA repair protein RecO [Betaproteobacteria bacterium]
MSVRQKVSAAPAWLLHSLPWRETSLIVEVFTRDYGKIALAAKGARRPTSALRGVLMAFQPLILDWSGSGEVKNLLRAEWRGGQPLLQGHALLCAYYLNELILRLTAREDAHQALFDVYATTMMALARGENLPVLLRRFELALLRELGYAVMLDADISGRPLQPETRYLYIIEHGPRPCGVGRDDRHDDGIAIGGQSLLDLGAGDFSRGATLVEAKRLLRVLINHTLGGQILHSRRVFEELQEL